MSFAKTPVHCWKAHASWEGDSLLKSTARTLTAVWSAVTGSAALAGVEAFPAVHWTIPAGDERHDRLGPAGGADSRIALKCSLPRTISSARSTASTMARRGDRGIAVAVDPRKRNELRVAGGPSARPALGAHLRIGQAALGAELTLGGREHERLLAGDTGSFDGFRDHGPCFRVRRCRKTCRRWYRTMALLCGSAPTSGGTVR